MAGKWSIATKEPSTASSASIVESTGVATFPPNQSTTTDNVYTITYTDDNGCVSTTDYTVKKCTPSTCDCDEDLKLSTTSVTLSNWETGGTEDNYQREVTITSANCITNITANWSAGSDNNWLHFALKEGKIIIWSSLYEQAVLKAQGIIEVHYWAGETGCTKEIEVSQGDNPVIVSYRKFVLNGCCQSIVDDCGEDYFIVFIKGDFLKDGYGNILPSDQYAWNTDEARQVFPGEPLTYEEALQIVTGRDFSGYYDINSWYMTNNEPQYCSECIYAYVIEAAEWGTTDITKFHGGGTLITQVDINNAYSDRGKSLPSIECDGI